jgi:hypothetical protein
LLSRAVRDDRFSRASHAHGTAQQASPYHANRETPNAKRETRTAYRPGVIGAATGVGIAVSASG